MVEPTKAKKNGKIKEATAEPSVVSVPVVSMTEDGLVNVVDTALAVPGKQAELIEGGKLRFIMNSRTLQLVKTIGDELNLSRGLPVSPDSISVTDPVVAHILLKERDLDPLKAREKGVLWYQQQKEQAGTDALFLGVTAMNEIVLAATPYEQEEVAFDHDKLAAEGGALPSWLQEAQKRQIPLPERDLNNTYERRLKVLYDFITRCGYAFTQQFYAVFMNEIAQTMRILDESDEDGF